MAERIFTVFEGTAHPNFPADEGDVKYHQGADSDSVRNDKAGGSPYPAVVQPESP